MGTGFGEASAVFKGMPSLWSIPRRPSHRINLMKHRIAQPQTSAAEHVFFQQAEKRKKRQE